jgi:protein required for attachment to host cells
MKTWVLVANRSRASLYLHRTKQPALTTVEQFDHPEGRLKDGEIDTDKGGRVDLEHASGATSRSTYQRAVEPHEHIAQVFAKKLAERLYRGRVENEYERLVLAAEPHFLGVMKDALDGVTAKLVHGTLSRDLTAERPESVAEYVTEVLRK